MLGHFNLPSVDNLREGIDYKIVDWSFADATPASQGCADEEKMVFGVCRKLRTGGTGEKDFDSSKKTKQEEDLEKEASRQGSTSQTNKAVSAGGKKYGWAIKDGKPVMVEWGSVAGTKKKQPPTAASTPAMPGAAAIGAAAGGTPPATTPTA